MLFVRSASAFLRKDYNIGLGAAADVKHKRLCSTSVAQFSTQNIVNLDYVLLVRFKEAHINYGFRKR